MYCMLAIVAHSLYPIITLCDYPLVTGGSGSMMCLHITVTQTYEQAHLEMYEAID